jgi:hypothetical protein
VLALWQAPRGVALRRLLVAGAATLPGLLLTVGWSYYRFGVPFKTVTGMGEHLLTPLSAGYLRAVAGLLVSPGKSLFLYSPILLALPFAFAAVFRRWPAVALGLLCFLASSVLFFAHFDFWHGDWAWGPRYLMAFGAAASPVVWLAVEKLGARAPSARAAAAGLALLLVLAQPLPLLANPIYLYFGFVLRPLAKKGALRTTNLHRPPLREDFRELYFVAGNSPLLAQVQGLAGAIEVSEEDRIKVVQRFLRAAAAPLAALLALLLVARSQLKAASSREGREKAA